MLIWRWLRHLQPSSLPARGAWIEMWTTTASRARSRSRSLHGERGLKLPSTHVLAAASSSLPARGAWIEISLSTASKSRSTVAPCTGSVDWNETYYCGFDSRTGSMNCIIVVWPWRRSAYVWFFPHHFPRGRVVRFGRSTVRQTILSISAFQAAGGVLPARWESPPANRMYDFALRRIHWVHFMLPCSVRCRFYGAESR